MIKNKALFLNTVAGLSKQVITAICGFILPRYIILFYGSEINGLLSSLMHFLGFISLLEFGIGPVIQSNLYKPLALKDNETISRIVVASDKFYRKIATFFLIYVAILFLVYPRITDNGYDIIFTGMLILILAISTFVQYYFGATYQLLLNADQKGYIQLGLQSIAVILNTVLCVGLIYLGMSIHAVKLVSAVVYILRPMCQAIYVRKRYSINRRIVITDEPIKQKWNGFAQHIAGSVCSSTDHFVLTTFSTLINVSIYNVYYNVVLGITNLIITAATGIDALWGRMLAKKEQSMLEKSFHRIEFITHFIVSFIFSVMAITLVPFIRVYTYGINDVDYVAPVFSFILVSAYAVQALRVPYVRLINAAGKFKETQGGAIISALINVILTIVLVLRYGLVGTAIGTLVAMLYHLVYFVLYLRKNIISLSFRNLLIYLFADIAITSAAFVICKNIVLQQLTFGAWILYAFKVSLITLIITAGIHAALHRKIFLSFAKKICIKRT